MDDHVLLAKKAIEYYLSTGRIMAPGPELPESLKFKKGGVFVSLHKRSDHTLRGCLGTFLPTKDSLASEIIENAVAAASRDFRFQPLSAAELNDLEINVDVLSQAMPIRSQDELDCRKFGIIVKTSDRRLGLLLPDIAGVEKVSEQIQIACQKAGIDPVKDEFQIYKFTVERHK